jgi:menaquinone-9 beta-reductase
MWTYFPIPDSIEGTTLYVEPTRTEYLDWIWEIPVSPNVISVGYVTTGAATKVKREQGFSVEDIFRQQLIKFPRFEELLQVVPLSAPSVTSFRSRAYAGVAGTNWLIPAKLRRWWIP